MGRIRQAVKCSGRRTDGKPCKAWAINGGTVCAAHGGRAPQVKARAARNVAEQKAQALLEGISDFEPITDPIAKLQHLAGRASRWLEVLEGVVADLHRIRYTTQAEQIDGRVVVFERAMDRTGKLLVDLARLNLDERSVRLQEAQVALVAEALGRALAESGLAADAQQAIRVRVAELVDAADGQQAALPAGRR